MQNLIAHLYLAIHTLTDTAELNRRLRRASDRGSISLELILLIGGLVAVGLIVVALLTSLASNYISRIET